MTTEEKDYIKSVCEEAKQHLKTCPFCGGHAEIKNTYTIAYWVECTQCDAQVTDPQGEGREGRYIHMATGVRTKHYEQFNNGLTALETCTGVQDVFMTYFKSQLEISVEDRYLYWNEIELLIKNDGLTRENFIRWFFKKNVDTYSGKIIHWTKFRY